ncbi:MAG: rRNA maturation RNase YbeY [candidate division WOR-3 bacterium]|nr:MAG: rRNA maturation RNase YbeY [candidate division WOR-3 bacterium]
MKKRKSGRYVRLKVFNPAGYRSVNKQRIRTLVRNVLLGEKAHFGDLHVIIVDDAYITDLNKEFFKKRGPTNVISFDLGDVGEVYVSCGRLRDSDDLYYYIVHGLLHLVGYVHDSPQQEKVMHEKCMKYLHIPARKPLPRSARGAK